MIFTKLHFVIQVTDSIVQVGNCGAICLKVEDTFGVVYISGSTIITCATCRYSKTSCKHIISLFQILSNVTDHEDIPKALLPIFQVYCQHNEDKILPRQSAPSLSCMSKDKILFDLTTTLSSILLMPSSSRFNIVDGLSMLIPETTAVCNRCGLINWSEDLCLFTGAHIVTMNCFVQTKGLCLTLNACKYGHTFITIYYYFSFLLEMQH